MNKKLSFDFDHTLSQHKVQELAKRYVDEGYEVHIVTARNSDANTHKYLDPTWREIGNSDLWDVVERIGIKKENVHFTEGLLKTDILSELLPVFHIDDDEMQLYEIRLAKLPIIEVSVLQEDWAEQCDRALK